MSGYPIPSPGDLPDTGIEPGSLALQADALPTELPAKPENRRRNVAKCSLLNLCNASVGIHSTMLSA